MPRAESPGWRWEKNQLAGALPAELGRLDKLQRLNLEGNGLNGAIPTELGNLANLESLSLRNNRLTGAIPAKSGNLGNLRRLHLAGNSGLTGCLPNGLRDVPSDDHGLGVCP